LASEVVGDNPEIDLIIDRLVTPGILDGIQLLDRLATFTRRNEIDQIYRRLTQPGTLSLASVRWLVRYLVRAKRPYAYQKLFILAQSRQEGIREEARNGLARIESEIRLQMLLAMLRSDYSKEVCFAVDWFGDGRIIAAIPQLIELYGRSGDEMVRVRVVRALGRMRRIEALKGLEQLLDQADEKMERIILLSLSQLVDRGLNRVLIDWLRSDRPKLRGLATYKILGKSGRWWERLAASELESETQSEIKLELLTSVIHIDTKRFFNVILNLTLFDPSDLVRQRSQSVIRGQKSSQILNWLLKFAQRCPEEQLPALLRIMNDYDEPSLFDWIMGRLQTTHNPLVRFAIFQAWSDKKERRALETIQEIVRTDVTYGPAASLTLSHLWDEREMDWVADLLEEPSEQFRFARNAILHSIGIRGEKLRLSDRVRQLVLRLLEDPFPQTRYVALLALQWVDAPSYIERLVALFLSDPVFAIRRAALHQVNQLVELEPQVIIELLRLGQVKPHVLTLIKGIFERLPSETSELPFIIGQLAVQTERARSDGKNGVLLRLLVLGRALLVRLPNRCLSILRLGAWSDSQLEIFYYVLNRTNLHEYPGLDIQVLIEKFLTRPFRIQCQAVAFLSRFKGDLSAAQNLMFRAFRTTQDPQLLELLERLINGWMTHKTVEIEGPHILLKG
jgi:HEAT repeat protein